MTQRDRAEALAYSLGICLYLNEATGKITQHPPGELIDPGPKARVFNPGPMNVEGLKNAMGAIE